MARSVVGRLLMLRPFCGALVITLSACQTYNFEPVTPSTFQQYSEPVRAYAIQLKPNVEILFDRSGSMTTQLDPTCDATRSPCATRISEAVSAMGTFMSDAGTLARFGLTTFPDSTKEGGCGAPSSTLVPLPPTTPNDEGTDDALRAQADLIRNAVDAGKPGGGTPTAAALAYVGNGLWFDGGNTFDGSDFRSRFILLVTDGLPNCNQNNPNNLCASRNSQFADFRRSDTAYLDAGADIKALFDKCDCQNGTTYKCLFDDACNSGCLDEEAAVTQVSALRKVNNSPSGQGIKTIVVGFGSDTVGGSAARVLQRMAQAGGFQRACPGATDAECGAGDTCNVENLTCKRQFYQVSNGNELATALTNIIATLPKPCQFVLDAQPTDPRYISVQVGEQEVLPGPSTWTYEGGIVTWDPKSQVCKDILAATNMNPVHITYRIVRKL